MFSMQKNVLCHFSMFWDGHNGSGVSSNTLTDYLHDFEELHFSISSDAHLKIVSLQS